MRYVDLIDEVDEGNAIAASSMGSLDNALNNVSNIGVNTTQMFANVSTFIRNVGDNQLRDRVTPVIERMNTRLDRELT